MHQQGCTLPTTAVILGAGERLSLFHEIFAWSVKEELWGAPGVSSSAWDFLLCIPAVSSGTGSPESEWVLGISSDRTIPDCLWVLLCRCFSSLMRVEHTIKFYWVFMLTKLTNSWCFKNTARTLSTVAGNLQWLFNWCRTEQMCECQCHLTANHFILTFYWPELINWNFQNKS